MKLRHLRCFVVVAEELHFARAAERLHIEQSPLSRIIKKLEDDLGTMLFVRTTRNTRLTRAGEILLEQTPRIFSVLGQARDSVKAVAAGFHSQLRIALSDGVTPSKLAELLAKCREDEPETDIRLHEVPLAQHMNGLRDNLFDVGFAQSTIVRDGIIAIPAWYDSLVAVIPARHPLLAYKELPLNEFLRYSLIVCGQETHEGFLRQVLSIFQNAKLVPCISEKVASFDLLLTLVAAGYGIGVAGESQINLARHGDVAIRPFAGGIPKLVTYMLRLDSPLTEELVRFKERVGNLYHNVY
ncbi:LysR family transcriptional regulator [Photorhabdus laumondii subsp. laumondii]|uniref:Photorhabdus luminescens subsp. laumondii TTO1 complete genome segment 10/17 n=2 Tax=Photorhabdus laumondii subsp. laumondii TaxID=141679 RepID=Q7N3C5_PHOLL|nr:MULTISPECIES: LysR substrate-binding domain-containing protein [Photorhabdus]AWK42512.1 D-alanyl-D-alanine endopeptidase [Photorhabdus laumondii subsp. laumondii]AXG43361.1 LysR family transcriptional regulator [Photorhabdus laumondii subsp. laumondii]AXG47833.1 LysR family transcriptional regulator [Photorhabdus laumondii subsp. laumondii]MCC8382777.1 LysR family transcriptional regulator [Photorhabdus laumondii]MCC8390040.1 LysR family transcriptional regulator [Photorhabdus laumondii]